MSSTGSKWRLDSPIEEIVEQRMLPATSMCRIFQPDGYEPKYPYPLLVHFHAHGGNEDDVLDFVPKLSRRNFVAVGIRGPQLLGVRENGQLSCGWGQEEIHMDVIHDHIMKAVQAVQKSFNIHSERVFLVGVADGAAAAYRAAFGLADRIGGLITLNGEMPRPTMGRPLFTANTMRQLPIFMAHGTANNEIPLPAANRDYKLLYSAGADVLLNRYNTNHNLTDEMFRDVNRWVISQLENINRFGKIG
jgi:phospholipase/carboxylesterase